MQKYLLIMMIWIGWAIGLEAKVQDVKYKMSFGLFGELGTTHVHLETKGNRYTLTVEAKAAGIAKTLSKNRKEKHISKGYISKGRYYANRYDIDIQYGKKRTQKVYKIDHRKKEVTKTKKKFKNGKLTAKSSQKINYYSNNDLLTLYMNLPYLVKNKSKPGKYIFRAVGSENKEGNIELYIPEKSKLPKYKDALGEGSYWYLTAVIYQKIFLSDKGELMLAIDEAGITQKAVLKDLVMFGDLVVKRVK